MEQIDYQHRSGFGCLRHRIDKTDPSGALATFYCASSTADDASPPGA
jgi:hypothetical protein